jgi:hypothetical protein
MYELVELCSCWNVIYMCYVSAACDIVIYILVNVETKKNIKWPLCQEGPSAKAPLPRAPGNYSRQLWEKFFQLGCSQLCRA